MARFNSLSINEISCNVSDQQGEQGDFSVQKFAAPEDKNFSLLMLKIALVFTL